MPSSSSPTCNSLLLPILSQKRQEITAGPRHTAGDTAAALRGLASLAWLWYGLQLLWRAERSLGFAFTPEFRRNLQEQVPQGTSPLHNPSYKIYRAPLWHATGGGYSHSPVDSKTPAQGQAALGAPQGSLLCTKAKSCWQQEWETVLWHRVQSSRAGAPCSLWEAHASGFCWQDHSCGEHTETEEKHVTDGEQSFCYGLFSLHCPLCL